MELQKTFTQYKDQTENKLADNKEVIKGLEFELKCLKGSGKIASNPGFMMNHDDEDSDSEEEMLKSTLTFSLTFIRQS